MSKESCLQPIEAILDQLQKQKGFRQGIPQTELQIKTVEKSIGLTLPVSYKKFLKQFGFATWSTGYLFGIDENKDFDMPTLLMEAQTRKYPPEFAEHPLDAIPIDDYGGTGYMMLFTKESPRCGEIGWFLMETYNFEAQTNFTLEEYILSSFENS